LCPELKGGAANANFTDVAEVNVTLRAFVEASGNLAAIAEKVEAEVATACLAMGHDLGLTDSDMKPKSGMAERPRVRAGALGEDRRHPRGGCEREAERAGHAAEVRGLGQRQRGVCRPLSGRGRRRYIVAHCEPGS